MKAKDAQKDEAVREAVKREQKRIIEALRNLKKVNVGSYQYPELLIRYEDARACVTKEHWRDEWRFKPEALTTLQEGEHEHDWKPCTGRICTSDLHTHHCSICNKHGNNPHGLQDSNKEHEN